MFNKKKTNLRCTTWIVACITFLTLGIAPDLSADNEGNNSVVSKGWTPLQFAIWNPVQLFGENSDVHGLRTSIFTGRNRDIIGFDLNVFMGGARDVYGLQFQGIGNKIFYGFKNNSITNEVNSVTGFQVGVGFFALLAIYPIVGTTYAETIRGFQISVVGNACNNVTGFQISGFANISKNATGFQVSLVNLSSELTGGQIGFANRGDYVKGLQIGFMNGATSLTGMQISAANFNRAVSGLQLGAVGNRIDGDLYGVQISSCVNIAQRVKGVQIGLVNYCRSMEGVQIGAVNIIANGFVPVFLGINASFSFD